MEKKTTAAKPVVKTTAKEASKDTVKEAASKICNQQKNL